MLRMQGERSREARVQVSLHQGTAIAVSLWSHLELTVCVWTMRVRKSGITERALRESHTHGQPEMNLRRRRCDPTAPEVVIVSSLVTAHRAVSLFVSLSPSQSRSTRRKTGRARRRPLRVREYIPAERDTHHTKNTEGRGRKERTTQDPTHACSCISVCM